MANTYIADLRHVLNPDGSIAPRSGPARRLAQHLAAIVQEITADIGGETFFPKARCRRKPNRKRCPGEIESLLNPDTGEIVWCCPQCGDNGRIRNWEGTLWDFSHVSPED
jgi:hypothetical protein